MNLNGRPPASETKACPAPPLSFFDECSRSVLPGSLRLLVVARVLG